MEPDPTTEMEQCGFLGPDRFECIEPVGHEASHRAIVGGGITLTWQARP